MKLSELFKVVKNDQPFKSHGVLTEAELTDLQLTEGLISSVDREQLLARISTAFPKKIKIHREKLYPFLIGLEWQAPKDHQLARAWLGPAPEEEKKLDRLLGVLGWFRSNTLRNSKGTFIQVEPKYDVLEQHLPAFLYHVTPITKVDKILKLGLTPKSNNRLTKHPERVYVANSKDAAVTIAWQFKHLDKKEYALLKIDTSKLLRTTRFYWDANFMNFGGKTPLGLYTMSNIPPAALERLPFLQ